MRLKAPQLYSQRDSQWASIILGYNAPGSPYTIGLYGCLITCFGMYIDKTPAEVNQLLKNNGGFAANSGDFYWSKCTVLGLTEIYTSPRYTDAVTSQGIAKMKSLLDSGNPLITEIDFNPATNGEEMHFLLITGYEGDQFFASDPWTGQKISVDSYGGAPRAVIQFRAYNKTLPRDDQSDSMQIILSQSDAFIAICTKLNLPANRDIVLAEIDKLLAYEDSIVQKDKQISDLQKQIEPLQEAAKEKQGELETLQGQLDELQKSLNTAKDNNDKMQLQIDELKKNSKVPTLTGWRLAIYKWIIR